MIAAASATASIVSSCQKSTVESSEELLNGDDVALVMRRKLGTKDFTVTTWSLEPIAGTNGFMGQYYNLRVTCTVGDKSPERYKFFGKAKPPRNSPQYDFAERINVFSKEIRVYEDLISRMGYGGCPKWSADFYLGKADLIMILEDATAEGYSMPDKYIPFEHDECVLMLRSLAGLHSRSLIFDENLRRLRGKTILDVYGEVLVEGLFPCQDKSAPNIIGPGIIGAREMVDLVEGLDDSVKRRVKNRITKWGWSIPRLVRPSERYRNVACHRDPWANNFMLKRDTHGRPEGLYLVDFQFLCYVPPAVDFMLSLYLNTRRKFRDESFETMAKIYHEFVRKEVESEGLDIDACLSWDEFRESCEYYRSLGIIYATINQQLMLMTEETATKYFAKSPELLERLLWGSGRGELVCPMFATVKEYRERMIENIMEIDERLADHPPEA